MRCKVRDCFRDRRSDASHSSVVSSYPSQPTHRYAGPLDSSSRHVLCVTLLPVRSECLGQFFHRLRVGPHAALALLSWWPAVNEVREKEARGRHQTQQDERQQILSGDRDREVKHRGPQGLPQDPDSNKKQHEDDPSPTTEVRAATTQ